MFQPFCAGTAPAHTVTGMLTRLRADQAKLHLGLMLALTFSTGIADAIGYLGLDKVFTGNMTGNVVILGMALVGAPGLPIVGPVIALLAFMLGAALSGWALRPVAAGWTHHSTTVFSCVGVLLGLVAVALFAIPAAAEQPWQYITTGAMAAAMGAQAAAARHLAVKDVTTVVVTSTLTSFAMDSWLGKRGGQPWFRRSAAIVLIGAGAALGAGLLQLHLAWGVLAAAVITLAVAVVGHLGRPRAIVPVG